MNKQPQNVPVWTIGMLIRTYTSKSNISFFEVLI